ncbi:hypothetical protein Tco_0210163 [Tanacetum coccineum]
MVINSPCLTDKKELAIPGQTATGKEFLNLLIAGSLPKTISAKNTATSKIVNSVKQIHAIVDGKAVVITESSVRNDLLFDDEDGITCLTNDEIFENIALMGVERAITTDASLVVAHNCDNINRTQTTAMPNVDIPLGMDTGGSPRHQETIRGAPSQTRSERVLKQPNEPPLPEGHTFGSGKGRMEHTFELMDIVLDLEKYKDAQAVEILKLKKRVESSDNDLDEGDASKQGRTSDKTKPMFKDSDFDDLDDLVDEGMAFVQGKDVEKQGKIGVDDTEAVNTTGEGVSTAAPRTPTTTTIVFDDEDVTMAMAQTLIKMNQEKPKEKGVAIKDVEDSSRPIRSTTTLQPIPTIDPKDKGKGILQETEPVEKTKKKVQDDVQIERDAKVALRLQAELDKEFRVERERQEEISKNMGGYKHSQLKGKSYEEIQGLYERQQKRIQDFTPMDSEKEAHSYLSMKKLEILKKNIKFRGGLLGLKDFLMILELPAAQLEENGVTRPKKYFELSTTEAIQADCDIMATNITPQGLPPEVYALVSNHKVAKELWERNSTISIAKELH